MTHIFKALIKKMCGFFRALSSIFRPIIRFFHPERNDGDQGRRARRGFVALGAREGRWFGGAGKVRLARACPAAGSSRAACAITARRGGQIAPVARGASVCSGNRRASLSRHHAPPCASKLCPSRGGSRRLFGPPRGVARAPSRPAMRGHITPAARGKPPFVWATAGRRPFAIRLAPSRPAMRGQIAPVARGAAVCSDCRMASLSRHPARAIAPRHARTPRIRRTGGVPICSDSRVPPLSTAPANTAPSRLPGWPPPARACPPPQSARQPHRRRAPCR